MGRKWLWCVAAILGGAIVWNEYRLWSQREPPVALQTVASGHHIGDRRPVAFLPDSASPLEKELALQQAYDRIARGGGEEESEATVIDLTWLQRQTAEPPVADTEEPAALPMIPEPRSGERLPPRMPMVPQFEPHSADGCSTFAGVWAKFVGFVWQLHGSEECEPLPVMPRLLPAQHHCPESSECPYLNGTAGQHYRR
jgi:hypothetical protein